MTNKAKVLEGLDANADSQTQAVANALSEDDATKLCNRIDSDIANQKGATPITTIVELRKHEDSLSYKLKFQIELWSSISLN